MLQDLRFTFRLMAKDRWYTAAAVVTLALAIGLNATVFTIANAAFIRNLPFQDSDRLYMLAWQERTGDRWNLSYADWQDWRSQTRTFDNLAGFDDDNVNISDDRAFPEQVSGAQVTANAFRVLRQPLVAGRDFVPTTNAQEPRRSSSWAIASGRTGTAPTRGCSGRPCASTASRPRSSASCPTA